MAISLENVFSIHDNALLLRGKRSSILASNIANVDTPNYKARDIDFKAAMNQVGQQQQNLPISNTHQRHISIQQVDTGAPIQYRNPLHASLDGNTVDSHVEQSMFAENAIQFQTSFTLLNGKVRGLLNALKGE